MAISLMEIAELRQDEFDIILVGTGPTQCFLATMCAMADKKVLHVDRETTYGASWNQLSLKEMVEWAQGTLKDDLDHFVRPVADIGMEHEFEECLEKSRHFIIERHCHLVYTNDALTDFLIDTKSTEYFKFSLVDHIYMPHSSGDLYRVPMSKKDLFNSKALTLSEKRALMKLVHTFVGKEEDRFATVPSNQLEADLENQTIDQLLEQLQTPEHVRRILMYAFLHRIDAYAHQSPMSLNDIERVFQNVYRSLMRFGEGCFLYPTYGTSCISEMMTRKCAIYGGTYVLGLASKGIAAQNNTCIGLETAEGDVIRAPIVVSDVDQIPQQCNIKRLSHCMLIVKEPLTPRIEYERGSLKNNCGIIVLPPSTSSLDNPHPIRCVQLDHSAQVVPTGYFTLYVTTTATASATKDLEQAVSYLCKDIIPIWKCFYEENLRIPAPSGIDGHVSLQEQQNDISMTTCFQQAQHLFQSLYPDCPPIGPKKHERDFGFDDISDQELE